MSINQSLLKEKLPQCNGSSDWVITVQDSDDATDKFIDIQHLVEMLLTLLGDFQDTESDKVVSEIKQWIHR